MLNRELIAINQDPEGRGAYAYRIRPELQWFHTDEVFILVNVLTDGDLAIGFFNLSDGQREILLQFWDLGLSFASGISLSLKECWEDKELGVFAERYAPVVAAHDCHVVRATLIRK